MTPARRHGRLLTTTALAAILSIVAPDDTSAQMGAQPPSQPVPAGQAAQPGAPQAPNPAMAQADADMMAVLQALQALGARPIETLTPEQARRQPSPADAVRQVIQQRGLQPPAAVRAVQTRDLQVQGAAGMLPARLYTPADAQRPRQGEAMPLIVYWHGGGWVIADLDTYDATPRALAAQTGAAVLSLHYRQAPEHRFPAAHEDAAAAYRWVLQNAQALGADPERIALAGESAGGNLAMAVAMAARDQDLRRPVHVLAIYPVAGVDMNTPSYREYAEALPLSRAGMEWFARHVFSDGAQLRDPRVDLVGRATLNGLPPTTVITAQIDPLRSEGEALAERLRQAGVATQHRNFDGATHEFFGMAPVVADATAAQQFAVQQLRGAFGAGGTARPMAPIGAATTPQGNAAPGMTGAGVGAAAGAAAGALTMEQARSLVGTNLTGAEGRNAGEIDNFVVDGAGQVRAAIVEWGGFLGIGERRAVVPVEQIRFGAEGGRAQMTLTREQLEALPRYERGRLPDIARERGWGEGLRLMRE